MLVGEYTGDIFAKVVMLVNVQDLAAVRLDFEKLGTGILQKIRFQVALCRGARVKLCGVRLLYPLHAQHRAALRSGVGSCG